MRQNHYIWVTSILRSVHVDLSKSVGAESDVTLVTTLSLTHARVQGGRHDEESLKELFM